MTAKNFFFKLERLLKCYSIAGQIKESHGPAPDENRNIEVVYWILSRKEQEMCILIFLQ